MTDNQQPAPSDGAGTPTPATRVYRTTTGSSGWPVLGVRVRPEVRAALVAEVTAARDRGDAENLQSLVDRALSEWLAARPR